MSSPRLTTVLLPPAKGSSIGGDGVGPPRRKCPRGSAATTKLGKIQRPQMGRIQRPLTRNDLHLVLLQAGYNLPYRLRRIEVVLDLKTVLDLGWQGRSRQIGRFRQHQFRRRGLRLDQELPLDHDLGRFPGQLRLVDDSLPRIPAFLSIDDSPPPPRRRGALRCFTDDRHSTIGKIARLPGSWGS
jgi:hypothetical protein